MRAIFIALAFVVAANAANTFNPVSFCERYTVALFTTLDAANELALINAVVTGAAAGRQGPVSPTLQNNVTGLFASPINKPFFDGSMTGSTNWMVAPNTAALVAKLNNFFAAAMNCRAVQTTALGNMQTVHSGMMITKAVWDDFFTQIATTLTSYGVSASADLVYATALLGQFKKSSTSGMQICNQADCEAANGYGEFTSGAVDGTNMWLSNAGTSSVTVPQGSTIHFNIGNAHSVVESDANWVAKTGGFTSGAVGATNSYNWVAPMADTTLYFICGNPAHSGTMRATIVVGTGGLSGASSVSASVAVVVAAVAAALALKF